MPGLFSEPGFAVFWGLKGLTALLIQNMTEVNCILPFTSLFLIPYSLFLIPSG